MRSVNEFKVSGSNGWKLLTKGQKGNESATFTTYLKEWLIGEDFTNVFDKHIMKGHMCENRSIELAESVFGFFGIEKNKARYSDEYFTGTPDVIVAEREITIDVKSVWSMKTLLEKTELEYQYYVQGQIYMALTGATEHIVFYALMNTPTWEAMKDWVEGDEDWDIEQSYEHLPAEQRYIAYRFKRNDELIEQLQKRVLVGREWLKSYTNETVSKIGKCYEYTASK